jgi:hypothetical protein
MGADQCGAIDRQHQAAQRLGSGAICTWKSDDRWNQEVVCIAGGRRYVCISSSDGTNCAPTSDAMSLEAK